MQHGSIMKFQWLDINIPMLLGRVLLYGLMCSNQQLYTRIQPLWALQANDRPNSQYVRNSDGISPISSAIYG